MNLVLIGIGEEAQIRFQGNIVHDSGANCAGYLFPVFDVTPDLKFLASVYLMRNVTLKAAVHNQFAPGRALGTFIFKLLVGQRCLLEKFQAPLTFPELDNPFHPSP